MGVFLVVFDFLNGEFPFGKSVVQFNLVSERTRKIFFVEIEIVEAFEVFARRIFNEKILIVLFFGVDHFAFVFSYRFSRS